MDPIVELLQKPENALRCTVELLQVMSVAHTWLTRLISNLKSLNLSNNRLSSQARSAAKIKRPLSSGPHHQDSGEAKIRESTAGGVSSFIRW